MHTLSNLIAQTFAADVKLNREKYRLHGFVRRVRSTPLHNFDHEVRTTFQWELVNFDWKWHHSPSDTDWFEVTGTGFVNGPELRTAFLNSGFDVYFIFSGVFPLIDSYLGTDQRTSCLTVHPTVAPGSALPDYEKLEAEVSPLLTMALLSTPSDSDHNAVA